MELKEGDKIEIAGEDKSVFLKIKNVSGPNLIVGTSWGEEWFLSKRHVERKVEELEWEIAKWDNNNDT